MAKKGDKKAAEAKQTEEKTEQKTETPAPAPAPVKDQQHGVTRPKADTKTGRIWAITDALSKKAGKPAARKDVINAAIAEGINAATAATQYGRWRKYFGLGAEPKEKPATPAEAAAAEADVELQESAE